MPARPEPHDPSTGRVPAPGHSAPPVGHARQPAAAPLPVQAGRHCWVYPPRECSHVPRAGLLLEWRRTPSGYEGLVVYLADLSGGRRLSQLQEWVAAEHLRPHR